MTEQKFNAILKQLTVPEFIILYHFVCCLTGDLENAAASKKVMLALPGLMEKYDRIVAEMVQADPALASRLQAA